jgi:predicted PurR-regulated permease PerM
MFIVPEMIEQGHRMQEALPARLAELRASLSDRYEWWPLVEREIKFDIDLMSDVIPLVGPFLLRVGHYTLGLLGATVFLILLGAIVGYSLIRPEPLLTGLLMLLPPNQRDPAVRAFVRGSRGTAAWAWSHAVAGAIEAVAVWSVLSLLHVPGATIWAVLAFFAELVPALGIYLMALPPTAVALAINPANALWVVLFYVAMDQVMGKLVTPYIRGEVMDLHPVSLMLAFFTFAGAFGLLGGLVALPLASFIDAAWQEFHLARQPQDEALADRVAVMLYRQRPPRHGEPPLAAVD